MCTCNFLLLGSKAFFESDDFTLRKGNRLYQVCHFLVCPVLVLSGHVEKRLQVSLVLGTPCCLQFCNLDRTLQNIKNTNKKAELKSTAGARDDRVMLEAEHQTGSQDKQQMKEHQI